jgi:hypothetical protein
MAIRRSNVRKWVKKFYPIPAKKLVDQGATDEVIIEHSLLKWREGTDSKVLREYNVSYKNWTIVDNDTTDEFQFDSYSCGFCFKYGACDLCPIFKFLGNTSCSKAFSESKKTPDAMIKLLEEVKQYLIEL